MAVRVTVVIAVLSVFTIGVHEGSKLLVEIHFGRWMWTGGQSHCMDFEFLKPVGHSGEKG
jgi:hypothetical protein